ncbi:DUF3833 family protein [Rhizobium sp. LjRoot30]|uniref:DUF3833 family protein n=1 Tax=Rhizobium sp. LjRoot30 TaxID=3342320 RepID=UPI003ED0186D
MRQLIRVLLVFSALSSLAFPVVAQEFQLEDFFVGRTAVHGNLSGLAGGERRFSGSMSGQWSNQALLLREDYVYEDGERRRGIWRISKVEAGRYIATCTCINGKAMIRVKGDTARFTYDVDIGETPGEKVVRASDRMTRMADGTVMISSRMGRYLFPVARRETIFDKRP